ncbi:MAG: glycine cleavage system protein GcvH [Steroidobacterales bacterium]
MSDIPNDLRYTRSHEWVRSLPTGQVEVGITQHAQSSLGDLVFVDIPEAGRVVSAGEACAVVESVKAASDIYSPVDGVIVAGNAAVTNAPELVNSDPYAAGWLMRIEPRGNPASASLLSAAEYAQLLADASH